MIHPDLGVGGAERLIVDASKALQESGHEVTMYTGYHDINRCFEDTRNGVLKTIALGQWIPRTIFGKFHALMANLKIIYIAFYLLIFTSSVDLILCDQVSACIPFLKLNFIKNKRSKIIFYCHFPDQLLTGRETLLKAIYRKPLDKFEEWSTSLADIILVNSMFTKNVVKRTFPALHYRELIVLYPCVDVKGFVDRKPSMRECDKMYKQYKNLSKNQFIYLSLNRFERKKGLLTAIESLSECLSRLKHDNVSCSTSKRSTKQEMHLIIAGGYDPRLRDVVAYYDDLIRATRNLKLENHVTFIKSPNDDEKLRLLQLCDVVVYTPENEHFGIVPLEAMAMSKPVIASASGGPLETIKNRINGYLSPIDDESSFANAMIELYLDQEKSIEMGKCGFEIVKENFSYEAFRRNLNNICFH